jgi:hypothetical protein
MDTMSAVFGLLAVIAAWNLFMYKQSGGRMWSPLSMAITATATAILFIVSGSIGYTLSRHDQFVAHTAWTGGVIWWQIGAGVGAAAVAVFLWRRGLRSIRTDGRTA